MAVDQVVIIRQKVAEVLLIGVASAQSGVMLDKKSIEG